MSTKNTETLSTRLLTAVTAVLSLGTALAAAPVSAAEPLVFCKEQERCFGVSKAGKNDCATSSSACSGTATQDFQKDAWVYLPKGSCVKLAGGSLTAGPTPAKKK
jgi:uncharacterized membrane protein